MNLIGLGIDVVEIDRISAALERHEEAFERKIFTSSEIEYCRRQKRPATHFAARFAAKEAIAKALGTGIGEQAAWTDLEIQRRESGEPHVVLSGAAKRKASELGVREIKISLTHAREYAAANAVLMG